MTDTTYAEIINCMLDKVNDIEKHFQTKTLNFSNEVMSPDKAQLWDSMLVICLKFQSNTIH